MHTPDELVKATYRYLAGSTAFEELYDIALDVLMHLPLDEQDTFAHRLSGIIVLREAEESSGHLGRDETNRVILEVLQEESLRSLRSTA